MSKDSKPVEYKRFDCTKINFWNKLVHGSACCAKRCSPSEPLHCVHCPNINTEVSQ